MDIASFIESLGKYADGATTITMALTMVGVIVTMAGVIVSTVGVWIAALWAKRSFKQKESSDAETSRPLMSAHLEYSDIHHAALLKISNIGATTANNVRVVFDDNFIERAETNNGDGFCNFAHILQVKYQKTRRSWVPGHSEIDMYAESNPPGTIITYKGRQAVDIDPPLETGVTIYYESDYTGEVQTFTSSYALDSEIIMNDSFIVVTPQKTMIDTVKGVSESVDSLASEVKKSNYRQKQASGVPATEPQPTKAISLSQFGKMLRGR